uniref:Uncharacterized protein n=1 Tax=Aegilops tauschii subsp. strangulata TaxID=200361 RepID=A0A453R363_AEGTS
MICYKVKILCNFLHTHLAGNCKLCGIQRVISRRCLVLANKMLLSSLVPNYTRFPTFHAYRQPQ